MIICANVLKNRLMETQLLSIRYQHPPPYTYNPFCVKVLLF